MEQQKGKGAGKKQPWLIYVPQRRGQNKIAGHELRLPKTMTETTSRHVNFYVNGVIALPTFQSSMAPKHGMVPLVQISVGHSRTSKSTSK